MKLKLIFSILVLIFFTFLGGGSMDEDSANEFFISILIAAILIAALFIVSAIVRNINKKKRLKMIATEENNSSDLNCCLFIGDDRCKIYFDSNKKQVIIMRVMTKGIKKEYINDFEVPDTNFAIYLFPDFAVFDPFKRKLLAGRVDDMNIVYEISSIADKDKNADVSVNTKMQPVFKILRTNSIPEGRCIVLIDECHGLIATIESGRIKNIFNYIDADNLLKNIKSVTSISIRTIGNYLFIMDDLFNILIVITLGSYKLFKYADIIEISYEENGQQLFAKSAGRIVGGSIVGGLLMGGAGAVVGGLSGSSKQYKEITTMDIKILLRDTVNTSYVLHFNDANRILNTKKDLDSQLYKRYLNNVGQAKDLLSVIIDKTKQLADNVNQPEAQIEEHVSCIADELSKLAKLKLDGILTEEEFQKQKAKLLRQ